VTQQQVATRVIRPEECVVAFGIPTCEASFRASHRGSDPRLFARSFSCYDEYEHRFLRPYRTATRSMQRSGARVVADLSLDVLGELCRSSEIRVVILFSHWEEGGVEMHGGFAPAGEIVQRVPHGLAKIVDLTVCHCVALGHRLARERPECVVRLSLSRDNDRGSELEPALWLGFYRALFLILKRKSMSYMQVFEDALLGLRKNQPNR